MAIASLGVLKKAAAGLLGLLMLASCTVVVDEGPDRPRPGPGPRPEFCTREYDPVCGERRGDRQTFANACEADRAGYRIVRRGECRRGGNDGGWGQGGGRDEPRVCTREYRPVCGQRGGSIRTFGNACEADAAGYRVVDNRPC